MNIFYSKWGCVEVYFGWVEIFYRLGRMDGVIFWVDGGMCTYILCGWTVFMGRWG